MGNKEEAGQLIFNVDLHKQALYQLEFLKAIENTPELKQTDRLKRAIYRYEKFWLPLAADHCEECLVAPLDIEWIWHCHMLCPVGYERDCETIVGKTVNHALYSQASLAEKQNISREYWLQKYGDKAEPFFVDSSTPIDENDASYNDSKLSYDIIAAAGRQAAFFYQVSLPHYEDKKFLEHSILRYKQFLFLKTRVEQDFLVPCYDIDLIWHTHQLNPVVYKEDMVRIIGCLFNHDDSVNERGKDSKLDQAGNETSENWRTFYEERFSLPGTMYRGKPPNGRLQKTDDHLNMNFDKEYASVEKTCNITLDKMALSLPPENPNRYRGIKLTVTICQGVFVVKTFQSIKKRISLSANTSNSIEMTDVGHGRIDSGCSDNLRFEVYGLAGLACCKSEYFLGSGTINLIQIINQRQFAESGGPIKERITLGENTSLDVEGQFWNLQFKQRWKANQLLRPTVSLDIGQYRTVLIPEDIQELFGPVALESRPESASNVCQTATHRYRSSLSEELIPLEVTFFHSQSLLMSVIQVIYNNKMAAIAHLVSSDQLPLPTQISEKKGATLSLNPKQGERAVIVKNNDGDWGVVIGKWTRFKRGVKGNLCDRAKFGSPGKLVAHFYKVSSGKILQYEFYKQSIEGVDVDIYTGDIQLDTTKHEIAEHVALNFAVSLLNVLCVPRPDNYKDGQKMKPKGNLKRGEKLVSVAITDDMRLMVASGLHTNTPSNYYISSTFGDMTCSLCDGKVTKCDADDWKELPGKNGEDPNRNGCGCGGSNPMNEKEFLSGMVGAGCGGCGGRKCRSECGSCGGSGKYYAMADNSKSRKTTRSDRAHAGTETKSGTGDSSSFAVDHLHISVLDYDSGCGGGGDSGGGCDTSSGFD